MKANYNLAKRKDPQTKTVKWYAVPASKGAMDTDETARMAVADTTLSKGEFKHVMEVASVCCDGRVVSLLEGGYGSYKRQKGSNDTALVR